MILSILDYIQEAAGPLKTVLGVAVVGLLIGIWVKLVVSLGQVILLGDFLSGNSSVFYIGLTGLVLFLSVPLGALILLALRIFFDRRVGHSWRVGMFFLWLLGIGGLVYSGLQTAQTFAASQEVVQSFSLGSDSRQPVRVTATKGPLARNDARSVFMRKLPQKWDFSWDFDNVDFEIKKSNDAQTSIQIIRKARGASAQKASDYASAIEYSVDTAGGDLVLPSNFFLPQGRRFHAQKVKVILYLPVGKKVFLDDQLWELNTRLASAGFSKRDLIGHTVVMTGEGLRPADAEDDGSGERDQENGTE